jgi:Asp-tRNA(Asn)/Glu-tRNA(Gln) amidotransferase A subunit family amidase
MATLTALAGVVVLSGPAQAARQKFVLEEATIASIHEAMKAGRLTARQLVEMYLARIDAYDKKGPALNAVILVNPNALKEADALDAVFKKSGFVGPLHGIPVLLKDNVETGDMATTAGSTSLKGFIPPGDAPIVVKLRKAGAIIIAKANLHEFAVWGETVSSMLGQTLNPYDLTRTPGGSSGGTGAGLAANFGTIGIGTDTVNSIRSPASANSIVGIRPTIGVVSRAGIVPYSLTQDTAGPLARTVEDAAKMLDVIAGYDAEDAATAWSVGNIPKTYTAFLRKGGLKGARVGVLNSFFGTGPEHREVNAAVRHAIEVMKKRGAVIVPLDDPISADKLVSEVSVHVYEFKDHLNRYLQSRNAPAKSLEDIYASGKFHPGIGSNIKQALGLSTSDVEYKDRLIKRARLQDTFMKLMADNRLDAIAFPHQRRLVVPVGETQIERQGILTSATGFPSIVIPAGFSAPTKTAPIGVPIGIEFVGRPWSEGVLIKLAYSLEQATKARKPPVSAPALK